MATQRLVLFHTPRGLLRSSQNQNVTEKKSQFPATQLLHSSPIDCDGEYHRASRPCQGIVAPNRHSYSKSIKCHEDQVSKSISLHFSLCTFLSSFHTFLRLCPPLLPPLVQLNFCHHFCYHQANIDIGHFNHAHALICMRRLLKDTPQHGTCFGGGMHRPAEWER